MVTQAECHSVGEYVSIQWRGVVHFEGDPEAKNEIRKHQE